MDRLHRLRAYLDDYGMGVLSLALVRRGLQHSRHSWRRISRTQVRFSYHGEEYTAYHHPYNRTWLNERAVEVPIALRFVERFGPNSAGLEVGNVLSHYVPVRHRVVDKYELAPGVENLDAANVTTPELLDYVVMISTLEHMGWDEPDRDLGKAGRVLDHIRSLLKPEGRLLVTSPLGYNPAIDALALGSVNGAEHEEFLVRDRRDRWASTDRPDLARHRYLHELRSAGAVWVAEFPSPVAR